jgi:intracellular sulfur oxidation DsrE/DsrF family protein
MRYLVVVALILTAMLSAKEYKVVFNCSSGDANYINSRVWLVGKTIDMIEEQGDRATVAMTLHGACVPMVSKEYHEVVDMEDITDIQTAQNNLIELMQSKKVEVVACAMSLARAKIDHKDVLPMVKISKNSFIDTIRYQNDGYALMTFK